MSKATIATLITFYNAAEQRAFAVKNGLTFTPEDKRELVRLAEEAGVTPRSFGSALSKGQGNTVYMRHYLRLKTFMQQVHRERASGVVVSQAPAGVQRKVVASPRLTIGLNAQIEAEIKKRRDAQGVVASQIKMLEKQINDLWLKNDEIATDINDLESAAKVLSK